MRNTITLILLIISIIEAQGQYLYLDDQHLSLNAATNILTLENGGEVDLSYLAESIGLTPIPRNGN